MFDFSDFPTLQTERLLLRAVTLEDAPALFRLRGDYEVTCLNTGMPYSRLDQAADLAAHIGAMYEMERELWWAVTVRPDPSLIGLCILYNLRLHEILPRATLGYEMIRDHWGQGFMTEAASAVRDWAFSSLVAERLEADADSENMRSIRVLERLGFQHEGRRIGGRWSEGEARDMELFSLTKGKPG